MGGAVSKPSKKSVISAIEERNASKKKEIRILLLGTGACGKSTILKQMRILFMGGFSDEERTEGIELVRQNCLVSIQTLIRGCRDLDIPITDAELIPISEDMLASAFTNTTELGQMIKKLWDYDSIQKVVARGDELSLMESAPYYLKKVDEIFKEDYLPSVQDMLQARQQTTGVVETCFTVDEKYQFRMIDVGGQRGCRATWMNCFEDVTAILFVASLAEYNQMLEEDKTRNRLDESLAVFKALVNMSFFQETSVVLFLNKEDLFNDKAVKIDLGDFHPKYKGGLDKDKAREYINGCFKKRVLDKEKVLYTHVTTATNTESVKFVWGAVKHILLSNNLSSTGLG